MRVILRRFVLILVIQIFISSWGFCSTISKEMTSPKEEEKFHIAARAFSDHFYDASLSLFKKFVNDFPESPLFYEAKLYIAKCYYYKEDYARAISAFTESKRDEAEDNVLSEVYYWLGAACFKRKDFDEAKSYTQKVINDYPDFKFIWEAQYLLGICNLELGQETQAQEAFNRIMEECPQEVVASKAYSQILSFYLKKKECSRIISLAELYLRRFPAGSLKARAFFYLGESYYAIGEWGKALKNYQNALRNNPDFELKDLIYHGLGFTYIEKKNKIEAKSNIDKIRDKELRLFSQGIYYFKNQDYIQALEVFNIFIRNYSQSKFLIEAYLNKADLFYEMGRLNDSISVYEYIISNFEISQYRDIFNKAHYGLAWCYLKNAKFKKAIDEFKYTLEYASNPIVRASSQIQIADTYQESEKYTEALDIYNGILKNQPNTVYADYIQFQIGMCFLKKKELDKAFLVLKNLKSSFPSSRLIPQVQYYLAVGYFSRGDYVEARRLLSEFQDEFPKDDFFPKVQYLYGKCFFNESNYDEALLIFKRLVGKFKDKEIAELAYIDMGNVYLNLSLFDKAKKVWVDFLTRYPHSQYAASVTLYLGGLCEKDGEYLEAEKYYKKAISDYKETSSAQEALLSLGHLYWNRGDLEKAGNYFKRLSGRETPLALKGKLYLAKVLARKGANQEALELYEELIGSTGHITKAALTDMAFFLKEIEDYHRAIAVFYRVIEQGVDYPELRFILGVCLEKVGKGQEAIEEYFKVIYAFGDKERSGARDSKNYRVKAYFRIARIYEKMGNMNEAKKVYQKVVNLGVEEAKIAEVRLKELE